MGWLHYRAERRGVADAMRRSPALLAVPTLAGAVLLVAGAALGGGSTALAALDPRDAETAGGAQSYAVDPVVRRIQELLVELGFYLGPFDGKLNGETAGAIRRYQRENRLVVNGVASRALLDGLDLKNQARQIEAARMALLASPATRAFVRGRDPAEQGDPRRDVRGCFAVPSPALFDRGGA